MHATSIPEAAIARGEMAGLKRPIDPASTAVVAIDFQRFFVDDGQPMGTEHARDALQNANRVHAAVRDAGGLVVLTQHSMGEPLPEGAEPQPLEDAALLPGSPSYELNPDLEQAEGDVRIVKHRSSPLHPQAQTELGELLAERGIETLVVTGLVTNGCCDCFARDAYQHGFNVVVATDATAAMSDEEHNTSLTNLAIYYAQVMDTDAIETALTPQPADVP